MTEPATELQRRYNRRSTQRRQEWRVQYALVTQAIRASRNQIKQAHRGGTHDAVAGATLRSLRLTAHLMMLDREDIAWDLKNSAYRWVNVVAA